MPLKAERGHGSGSKKTRRALKAGLPPGTPVFVGERKQDEVHISIMRYSREGFEELPGATLEDCQKPRAEGTVSWINITGMHDVSRIAALTRHFGLHPLTTEDIVNTGQRPKAEEFEHYIFLVLKMLAYDGENGLISIENVSLVLGEGFVLSFQEKEGDVFNAVRNWIRGGRTRLHGAGADFLAYTLMDAILDGYFVAIEKLGDHIEALDDQILTVPDSTHMNQLHHLKREILFLRRSVWPLREEISSLAKSESPLIGATTHTFLRDLYDHTIQIIDMIETQRDIIGGMHDTFLSSISNRMNEIMKVLTLIATIFIPLTFIAGIYGMNFENMPELEWRYGYFIVVGVMALLGAALLVFFKRRKWL